jgi:hypothetical protein
MHSLRCCALPIGSGRAPVYGRIACAAEAGLLSGAPRVASVADIAMEISASILASTAAGSSTCWVKSVRVWSRSRGPAYGLEPPAHGPGPGNQGSELQLGAEDLRRPRCPLGARRGETRVAAVLVEPATNPRGTYALEVDVRHLAPRAAASGLMKQALAARPTRPARDRPTAA